MFDFKVVKLQLLNYDTYLLGLKCQDKMPEILPGQFVNVKIENTHEAFLRRPISVHDVDYKNNILYLYIKIVGCGTKKLSNASLGDLVNIILPLGNTFNLKYTSNPLLVGGGCGIAPLLYLAKDIVAKTKNKPTILMGVKTKEDILRIEEFKKYAKVLYTTEDGSAGEKGYPIEHTILKTNNFDFIYTCGPSPMMKAVAKFAKENNITCEVSLENTMACGFGACLCCVEDTNEGNKCVCTDGPIFNINDLKW